MSIKIGSYSSEIIEKVPDFHKKILLKKLIFFVTFFWSFLIFLDMEKFRVRILVNEILI